jgi:glycosyltransferase involved in cell wall biosynthesis
MRSFHPVYNPLMAVRVLEEIRRTYPEARLIMAGQDKGMRPAVEEFARRRGILEAIEFPGFLDMEGKCRAAQATDIFINTSHADNMPVAVVEACAFGQPVISTRVGGVGDLIANGRTGLLVDDDDAHGMAAAVRRLLADPALAFRLAQAGRSRAEESSWDRVRPLWESCFAEVLSRDTRGFTP